MGHGPPRIYLKKGYNVTLILLILAQIKRGGAGIGRNEIIRRR